MSVARTAVPPLGGVRLVEHEAIRLNPENFVGRVNLSNLPSGCGKYVQLHFEDFLDVRIRTTPPAGPGTEPPTKITPFSSLRAITSRFMTVVRAAPMWP